MGQLIDLIQSEVGESFQQNGNSLMQRIIVHVSTYQVDTNLWLRTVKSDIKKAFERPICVSDIKWATNCLIIQIKFSVIAVILKSKQCLVF